MIPPVPSYPIRSGKEKLQKPIMCYNFEAIYVHMHDTVSAVHSVLFVQSDSPESQNWNLKTIFPTMFKDIFPLLFKDEDYKTCLSFYHPALKKLFQL